MDLIESYGACKLSDFKVKNASQKWSQTSPKSILALHTMKKLTENSNMTFWYLTRSIDTNLFWVIFWLPCNKSYVSFVNVSKSHMCNLSMYQKSMYLKSMSHIVSVLKVMGSKKTFPTVLRYL